MIVDDRGLVLVMVRGDHRVNEIKLAERARRGVPRRARGRVRASASGRPATSGRSAIDVPILLDDAVEPGAYITGANRENAHLRGVEPGRDFPFKRGDVRTVEAGDTVDGSAIRIEPAIEVGNIFKLGTRYSEPLGATYLDESGTSQLDLDGLLRPRPGAPRRRRGRAVRRRAAASPGRARWRRSTSTSSGSAARAARSASSPSGSTSELREAGLDVLYDDRDAGPGEKFADAELLGVPLRLTVGRRTLAVRRGRGAGAPRPRDALAPARGRRDAAAELWRSLP